MTDGLELVRREYPTDIGPVDLLCRDADGSYIAVEIKRRGKIDGVEQLRRYTTGKPSASPKKRARRHARIEIRLRHKTTLPNS